MKIKIIDLLQDIAKGRDVPKMIKWNNLIWVYDKKSNDYFNDDDYLFPSINSYDIYSFLNSYVEILEEKTEKIEKYVNTYVLCDSDFYEKDNICSKATAIIDKAFEEYSHSLNEVIDKVNKLLEKSGENEESKKR